MAKKPMKHKTKAEEPTITTASTSDIAFLLLVFFMVTTVFRTEQGLRVELPSAYAAKKVPIKDVAHVYVNKEGVISIDDKLIPLQNVGKMMSMKKMINPAMIASLMIDKDTNYGFVNDIFEEFSRNNVLRISLSTKLSK